MLLAHGIATTRDQTVSEPLPVSAEEHFKSLRYARMNARRLEHLAAMALAIESKTVLEIGAGIGDLTSFFLDRGCSVTSVEPRSKNLEQFRTRYEGSGIWPPERLKIVQGDVYDFVGQPNLPSHQIVFCYGLLYHLDNPADAIGNLASRCTELLLLETCVAHNGQDDAIAYHREDSENVTNSITGGGCLPTRQWVFNRLREHFEFVYMPLTQPAHDQFRLDWNGPIDSPRRSRSIFIASRTALQKAVLIDRVPGIQYSHYPPISA
jgi:SAM-dependent methyltransferase